MWSNTGKKEKKIRPAVKASILEIQEFMMSTDLTWWQEIGMHNLHSNFTKYLDVFGVQAALQTQQK